MTMVGTCPDCDRRVACTGPRTDPKLCRHGFPTHAPGLTRIAPCPGSRTTPLEGSLTWQTSGRPVVQR